jgi:nitrite reductase/ring-hydroxylating ferredoxin subunit
VSVRSPVPQPSGRLPPLENTTPVWNRAWIAVSRAAEIPDNTPVQVLVAGEAWVVTRIDGALTAFEDRCPHRHSPLSAGSVTRAEDGSPRLTCAVHGWRFDATGQCDLMPGDGRAGRTGDSRLGQHGHGHHGHGHRGWHGRHDKQGRGDKEDRPPESVTLRRAYGITERYGLVWLAVDEPLAPLPEFPEWADDGMDGTHCQPVRVQASAGQVIDGFLDTAGVVTAVGWQVTGVIETPYGDSGQAPGRHRSIVAAGPNATVHRHLELPHATIGILITAQPEDRGTTRVFKLVTRDDLGGDLALVEKFAAAEDQVLAENLARLKGYATAPLPLDEEAAGAGPVSGSPGSQLNLAWRRLMARAVRA